MTFATVPHSVIALVIYALWAIALALMVAADRTLMVMGGKAKLTDFTPGTQHGTESYWRINRAQANTAENLAIFAAIVLSGWVAGQESHLFNLLAVIVVIFRVIQSFIHMMSGSTFAIQMRFGAFAVQVVCEIWMAVLVLMTANVI
ncbi:MAG TPA: MAPEG family protein [Rhizomicrobium sp.]|jgi:hypothetical protein